jgi:hypothetical protein
MACLASKDYNMYNIMIIIINEAEKPSVLVEQEPKGPRRWNPMLTQEKMKKGGITERL